MCELALWRGRFELAQLPQRVRFLWVWLLSPMVLWLLIPFTWRLRTLGRISAYDMRPPPEGLLARLRFYPQAAWESWFPTSTRWLLALLLVATLVAAWRSREVRQRLLPHRPPFAHWSSWRCCSSAGATTRSAFFSTSFLSSHSARRPGCRRSTLARFGCALACTATVLLALPVAPCWSRPALATTLSEGFVDAETGDACRALAEALPITSGVLLNETSLRRRQACAMWVTFAARERGADVDVRAVRPRAQWREALLLTERCDALEAPQSLLAEGPLVQAGPLCGQRFRAEGQPPQ